jgi:glycosyltransferase involved in cell wall biosynthesis
VLRQITPVLLTYNEEENIGRTLERLSWAPDIVVVDSYSTDKTVAIARSRPQVRLFQRTFDSHAQQWNFAIQDAGVTTEWILALDADYVLTDELVNELAGLRPEADISGYLASFRYCVRGMPLRSTLYPPVNVLYRKLKAHYIQDGHTQRVQIEGCVGKLRSRILHDDRKSLSKWLQAQDRYMQLEAQRVLRTKWSELQAADKVRRLPLFAPFLVFIYCYFGKLLLLDGRHGLYYAIQRTLAELLLALRLIEAYWCGVSSEVHSERLHHG